MIDTSVVLTVGDGRGFVVEGRRGRHVITAARCLPELPPPHGASYLEERTYHDLLAPLGEKPSVWGECLFVDPIADIAVLGEPDGQSLWDEAVAYEELVNSVEAPLTISALPLPSRMRPLPWPDHPALLVSLDRRWFGCRAMPTWAGFLGIKDASEPIRGGMSGSPILAPNGTAIGIVCLGSGSGENHTHTEGGPNPHLVDALPGWCLRDLGIGIPAAPQETETEEV
jgi:hypothetical protein